MEGSITKKFDGNFAKFVLANKNGWKEKTQISGDVTSPLAVIMARIGQKAQEEEPIEIEQED